jgi:hypothetical protein
MLREALDQVMALQTSYTASNSEQMKERSVLIRRTIPDAMRTLQGQIAARLDVTAEQVLFAGSDGVGQKTPYCWVHFASRAHLKRPLERHELHT